MGKVESDRHMANILKHALIVLFGLSTIFSFAKVDFSIFNWRFFLIGLGYCILLIVFCGIIKYVIVQRSGRFNKAKRELMQKYDYLGKEGKRDFIS